MSNKQMFDMDSAVFRKTEDKKNIMAEKHKKKLTYHKQLRAGEKSTDGNKKEQKKTGETVSTVHISSDSTPNLPSNSEKTKPKKANKRRKKKSKSKSNKQTDSIPYCTKTGPVTDDDDVIVVGESTKQTKHQQSKKQETTQSTCNQNKPAKNVLAPDTKKSYARAIKHGARTTMQGLNKDSLHKHYRQSLRRYSN